jgi:hypothetical protein
MTTRKLYHDGRPELELGQRLTFTHKAVPVTREISSRSYDRQRFVGRAPMRKDGAAVTGVFVGWRNAQEGVIKYDEDGPQFRVMDRPLVALVSYDDRRNPVMVHPTDLTPCLNLEDRRLAAKIDAVAELDWRLSHKRTLGEASESEVSVGLDVIKQYRAELGEVGQ